VSQHDREAVERADSEVLEFYRRNPFNWAAAPDAVAAQIRKQNSVLKYPPLAELLASGSLRVLDVGCGAGWLTNSVVFHTRASAIGIDFNPVAIQFAKRTAQALGVGSIFHVADLLRWVPSAIPDVVVSIGVLHHTSDCIAGLRRVFRELIGPGGHALIGLYHKYGRKPFLEHFEKMKCSGASEGQMYQRFRLLFGTQALDESHCRSWFLDQVMHPRESQHSLSELIPVLSECDMELLGTSFSNFAPITNLAGQLRDEIDIESVARESLDKNRYFPGFFVIWARRKQ
jgi:SAM-dependent methyltransferase